MVPKRVGDELRHRRLRLGLKQADVARALGTTRAYVSAVERAAKWDPDTEKLVVWARTLGWEDDYLIRRLGRVMIPVGEPGALTASLLDAIRSAVAAGVREGVDEALRELGPLADEVRFDAPSEVAGAPPEPHRERLA